MSNTLRRAPRLLLASALLVFCCVFLAGCNGTPLSRTVPLHLSNQTGRDVTAHITSIDYDDSSYSSRYYGTPNLPLNGYTIASGAESDVSIPASALHSPLYIYLSDSTGGRFFYADIDVPTIGEYINLTLRMENDQMVLDVDWGNGSARTLRPVTSAEEQYEQFSHWYGWNVVTYEEFKNENFWLLLPGYNEAKWAYVYGDNNDGYSSKADAEAHMVRLSFPIWKLSNGKKVSSSTSIWINSAVADEVVRIFTEIYNDPEQFPINSVGGYSWRGDTSSSLHNPGLAIDINPNENYQIRYGKVVVGTFWDPSTSPYSISEDSSVVRIFAAHGWSWGGNAWAGFTTPSTEGNHDYMHFSYFGT